MKQGTAILDVGNGFIKILVDQVSGLQIHTQPVKETLEGAVVTSKGIHGGIIRNGKALKKMIEIALKQTRQRIGVPVENVYASINHPAAQFVKKVFKRDLKHNMVLNEEVMEQLTDRVQKEIQANYPKYTCLTIEPISIVADGDTITNNYQNSLVKKKIEIEYGCFLFPENILQTVQIMLEQLVDECTVVAAPLVTGALISEEEREIGSVVVDIGADITNIAVWKHGILIGARSLSAGGSSITNALALSLQISVQEAEQLKREYINKETSLTKATTQKAVSTYRLQIAREIATYIKDIDAHKLFPGGITLIGGGSIFPNLAQLLSDAVGLYTRAKDDIHVVVDHPVPSVMWDSNYALLCSVRELHKEQKRKKAPASFSKRFLRILSRVSSELS